jgi:hypothetical protein
VDAGTKYDADEASMLAYAFPPVYTITAYCSEPLAVSGGRECSRSDQS